MQDHCLVCMHTAAVALQILLHVHMHSPSSHKACVAADVLPQQQQRARNLQATSQQW
jgi:hypothetical protein